MAFTKSDGNNKTKIKRRDNKQNGTLQATMDTKITGSDLMEKKLFFHTDSAIVEA